MRFPVYDTDAPAGDSEKSITRSLNISDRGAYVTKNSVFLDVTPCRLESVVSILKVEELLTFIEEPSTKLHGVMTARPQLEAQICW